MEVAAKHVAGLRAGTDGRPSAAGQIAVVTRPLCRIKIALGEVEQCPQGACPFWEHGGAVIESGCGLERLSLDLDRSDVARHFVELRHALERARDEDERRAAREAFAALAPPELAGR
jgi:hypothetical protein